LQTPLDLVAGTAGMHQPIGIDGAPDALETARPFNTTLTSATSTTYVRWQRRVERRRGVDKKSK